jgi:FtsP/CotA-like multicopper oxidase with cupredoxin domain
MKTHSRALAGAALTLLLFTPTTATIAQSQPELIQPPICSAKTIDPRVKDVCKVTSSGIGHKKVEITLTAQPGTIHVAGYNVDTEHYNNDYLTPVVEAMPGDTVDAHVINHLGKLPAPAPDGMTHGDPNPTNLHYFHGGIVTPRNSRPTPAERGTGDNVYVHLASATKEDIQLTVPIPDKLDARVLEQTGEITHPVGLDWYHSHLHGISSDQVLGGMSGLLSVGEATANVRAACINPKNGKCSNPVDQETKDLKRRTEVRYVMLRDMPVADVVGRPDEPNHSTATWAPRDRDFPQGTLCGAWDAIAQKLDTNPKLRLGFCQKTATSAWLFTLNGQLFPKITVPAGKNMLLRLGDVSANIGYWLEIYCQKPEETYCKNLNNNILDLTVLSVDGIVPVSPASPSDASLPVQANKNHNLLLMPASRAEVYIRNDQTPHAETQYYVLRTKGLQGIGGRVGQNNASPEEWPEIQLALIVLEPNKASNNATMGLNALVARNPTSLFNFAAPEVAGNPVTKAKPPEGCVADLDPQSNDYRRVTFIDGDNPAPNGDPTWNIVTGIVHSKGQLPQDETSFTPDPNSLIASPDRTTGVPFESYELPDGNVDWANKNKPHVCIELNHQGSHQQLWVLQNGTSTLHNFHIHQMKFRLATGKELAAYNIKAPNDSTNTCGLSQDTPHPDYRCWESGEVNIADPQAYPLWHDTIPMPPGQEVFVIMSYDAPEQLGRFVFHCHILKHEDNGLMAPIEVWDPFPALVPQIKSNKPKE